MAKARYWTAVLYPESMKPDWQETIGDDIGFPYAYCVHDKDCRAGYKLKEGEEYQRKTHVHLIIAYSNTTTYNSVLRLVNKLSAEGKVCANKVEVVSGIRNCYDYLIHNTESAKKQKKYLYDVSERVTGNNFDIGAYEQVSVSDKRKVLKELCSMILDNGIYNFVDLYEVVSTMDDIYFDVMASHGSFLEKLIKGNYHKYIDGGSKRLK